MKTRRYTKLRRISKKRKGGDKRLKKDSSGEYIITVRDPEPNDYYHKPIRRLNPPRVRGRYDEPFVSGLEHLSREQLESELAAIRARLAE